MNKSSEINQDKILQAWFLISLEACKLLILTIYKMIRKPGAVLRGEVQKNMMSPFEFLISGFSFALVFELLKMPGINILSELLIAPFYANILENILSGLLKLFYAGLIGVPLASSIILIQKYFLKEIPSISESFRLSAYTTGLFLFFIPIILIIWGYSIMYGFLPEIISDIWFMPEDFMNNIFSLIWSPEEKMGGRFVFCFIIFPFLFPYLFLTYRAVSFNITLSIFTGSFLGIVITILTAIYYFTFTGLS